VFHFDYERIQMQRSLKCDKYVCSVLFKNY
jgi:hypothetical protein